MAVYIGSWEVKCPHCGKYTPLVGNWWLARVAGSTTGSEEGAEEEEEEGSRRGAFRRLAWMEPVKSGDTIAIRVVDLNKELGRNTIQARVNSRQGIVETEGRQYRVPQPNIDARRETALCLHCNNQIRKGQREWHVKEALKDWNQKLEQYLAGQIDLETLLKEAKARPRILAKVKITNKDLVFEPATQNDTERLWKALEKLKQIWGDLDIPTELLPHYENRSIWVLLYGFDKWFKLFNPRQLLTLVKLIKLIREAGNRIEEEKLREGWSREDAHKYAEAVTTYLAIALVKYADFNSLVTAWNAGYEIIQHTLAVRGIAMQWNWVEGIPYISVTGTFIRTLRNVTESLEYLINAVSGSPSRVRVLLDDATALSRLGDERFDLIVTDPPYRDDVPYAELSDFYYVWLKRALSGVGEVYGVVRLVPRFYREAFFDEFGNEVETQWRAYASREVSEAGGRREAFGGDVGSFEYFKRLLRDSFKAMASRLKENGVIVTFYAHTSPEAWEALLEAGWLGAGMRISAAHSVATESLQRVTARGKASLDTSIVAVWRRGVSGEALAGEVYAKAVEACRDFAFRARENGYRGTDLFVATLGCILSQFTQYGRVLGAGEAGKQGVGPLVGKFVYPATAEAIAKSLGALAAEARLGPTSLFYLLTKVLAERGRAARRSMDRSTLTIFSIGTRATVEDLERLRIVNRDGDRITLMEPRAGDDPRRSLEQTLAERDVRVSPPTIRCAVDALHLLEYLAVTLPKEDFLRRYNELRTSHPQHTEEAITLAKILASVLPENDVERRAIDTMLRALGMEPKRGLEAYSKR